MYSHPGMTRVGIYCFHTRPFSIILFVAAAVVLFAPGIVQAAFLMFVGTCPITAVAGLCKASKLHICGENGEDRGRDSDAGQILPGPYAGLAGGMFGKRK